MAKRKQQGLVNWFYNTSFMKSLELDKRFFIVFLLDIAFIIGIVVLASTFKHLLNYFAMQANEIAPAAIRVFEFMSDPRIQATPEIIGEVHQGVLLLDIALKQFLWKTIATLVVLITLAVFLVALIKGYAWKRIKQEEFTKIYLKKFFLMNLAWFWSSIAVFFGFLFFLKAPLDTIIAQLWILLFFYLVMVMHASFTEKKSIWQNTHQALYYAFVRIGRFIPVNAFFIFFMVIILLFSGVLFSASIKLGIFVSFEIAMLILSLLFLMETAWIKFYYYEALNHGQK